jgi:hypothetical protein
MIDRNGESVDDAAKEPPRAPKKRKKRLVTDKIIAANRRNSKSSTGPKTESGRKNSRFNGTRHGLASREIMFLEGEDPQEFWDEVDLWCRQRGIRTADERTAIANGVYSVWVKARVISAQAHAYSDAVDSINHSFAGQKMVEVRELFEGLNKSPEVTIAAVMNSAYGCSLLIKEFTALSRRLKSHCSFEVSQREHALRLGGHRPKELFTSKVVEEFNRSYFGSLHGPGGFTAAQAANALMADRPDDVSEGEFERRLERVITNLPTIEEGHARLTKYVKRWIAQLTERKELMEYREEKQKEAAIGKALADVSAAGQVLVRYGNQADQRFSASMRLALALKAERLKHGDGDLDEPEAPPEATDPAETAAPEPVPPDVEAEKPTEAVATEMAVPATPYNADPPAEATADGPGPRLSAEDDAAIRAHYRQSLETTERKLYERYGKGLPDTTESS